MAGNVYSPSLLFNSYGCDFGISLESEFGADENQNHVANAAKLLNRITLIDSSATSISDVDEVKSTPLLKLYSQLLSPTEEDKLLHMRGHKLQRNALLACTLLRTTIATYYNFYHRFSTFYQACRAFNCDGVLLLDQTNNVVDPQSLMFNKNRYGKPDELDWQNCNHPPLHFNISHTDSLIACGVTVHVPVGIDVENKERKIKHNVLPFATRFYSADEVKFLSTISDPEVQRKEFIKLWTLKEAYVKALGKGFSAAPSNTFTIQSKAGTKGSYNLCEATKCNGEWKFALLELVDSHYAAICIEDDQASGGAPYEDHCTENHPVCRR